MWFKAPQPWRHEEPRSVIQTFGKQRWLPAICTLNEAAHNYPLLTSGG